MASIPLVSALCSTEVTVVRQRFRARGSRRSIAANVRMTNVGRVDLRPMIAATAMPAATLLSC
jgi:hypothetical protein